MITYYLKDFDVIDKDTFHSIWLKKFKKDGIGYERQFDGKNRTVYTSFVWKNHRYTKVQVVE